MIRKMMIPGIKEERRMRKISVIGASLLLLAVASCSREKETTPADGFVKMRFTAVVGETRTAYENDKTASWVAGDAISVYVTNGTDGQVVTFTAGEDLTFEGSVPAGYETIVAGAYPADAAHTFNADGVSALHLPGTYNLDEGDDPASVLPLAGTYAAGVMTFRHPAGALKFTIDNVPANATCFEFKAAGQKVNGSFPMDPALAATEVESEQSVRIAFPEAAGTHTFYVPMPAGELAAGASIALYDFDNEILFQKTVPQALTVSKNVIKRIAAVETWNKNEAWQATYLRDEYSSSAKKVYSKVRISGTTGNYGLYLATRSTFDSKYGSAEGFLASNYIPERKAAGASSYSSNGIINYNKMTSGQKVMIIYGVDDDYNFTGEYNLIEFEVPAFYTPEGWSMTFYPQYNSSSNGIVPAVSFKVSEGSTWLYSYMKKSVFESYGSDPAAFIWAKRTSTNDLRVKASTTITYSTLEAGEYVFISYGMTERVDADSDRIPTGEYCLLEFSYEKPTDAYQSWIGKWSVTDGTPKTDTWTVSAKSNNHTYDVKGMGSMGSYAAEALFDAETGQMKFKSQKDFVTVTTTAGEKVSVCLYGGDNSSFWSGIYDLMFAAFDDETGATATLTSYDTEKYLKYLFYGYVDGKAKYNYGTRTLPSTMTRVVSEGVLMPDGEPAEEEAGLPEADAPVVVDDALPGE